MAGSKHYLITKQAPTATEYQSIIVTSLFLPSQVIINKTPFFTSAMSTSFQKPVRACKTCLREKKVCKMFTGLHLLLKMLQKSVSVLCKRISVNLEWVPVLCKDTFANKQLAPTLCEQI